MYTVICEHVFPWLRILGGNGTTYSKHMEGARFTIPTPALLAKVVDMIDIVHDLVHQDKTRQFCWQHFSDRITA